MGAVRALARAELRSGRRSLLVVALLLGLVGGAALAAAAVAQRTATTYPRLVAATGLDDARVFVPADQPGLLAAVPGLPGVATAWPTSSWIAQIEGPVTSYVSVGAGVDQPDGLSEPVVVAGRAPAPDAADELLIGEPFAETSGARVGDTITLKLLTTAEIARFTSGFGEPDGATVEMRVVGIGRMTYWGGILPSTRAGPAFARTHEAGAAAHPVFLRLDGSPGAAARFAAAFTAAVDREPVSIVDTFLPLRVELPTTTTDPTDRAAERVLTGGAAAVAVVLAAGGLLVAGQLLAQRVAASRGALRVKAALGLTPGQRVSVRVLSVVPAAVLAGAVGGALGLAAGALPALGSQARFEPVPGFLAPWPVAVPGGALLAAGLLLLTALITALTGRPSAAATPTVAPPSTWWARRPALLVGAGLALRGRARGASTVLGAALVVAGVVAAATVGAGLTRLVDSPQRYGQHADLSVVDAHEDTLAALVEDPRVTALDVVTHADVTLVDGSRVGAVAHEHRLGTLPVETVAGRVPGRAGEVAIGPRLAARLGIAVGDVLAVRTEGGATVPLAVAGVVVADTTLRSGAGVLGEMLLVTPGQLPGIAADEPQGGAYLRAAPGQADALLAELSRDLWVQRGAPPGEIRNLGDLVALPELLAAALAAVGGVGLVYAVVGAARRHAAGLAVLAALGATPRQVRRTVAVLAVATAAPAVVLGVPIGLALGRVLWWEIATGTGVGGDVALPGVVLVALAPSVLAVAVLAAARPASRLARVAPATLLRGE